MLYIAPSMCGCTVCMFASAGLASVHSRNELVILPSTLLHLAAGLRGVKRGLVGALPHHHPRVCVFLRCWFRRQRQFLCDDDDLMNCLTLQADG